VEWKKLLRTSRNCHILHMPMEWISEMVLMLYSKILAVYSACQREYVNILWAKYTSLKLTHELHKVL
jgi:hypothetical protein